VNTLPVSLATADVNGDQRLDLVVTSAGNADTGVAPQVTVLLGNGAGGFGPVRTQRSIELNLMPTVVALADFDSDGMHHLDLAIACTETSLMTNEVRVLLGDGTGRFEFASTSPVGRNPTSIAVVYLHDKTKPDIVVANYSSGNISILRNQF
jgi:hypothetical protein